MAHWTDNMNAFESLNIKGVLPNRCIPKINKRKNLKLWEVDESKIYKFLRSHPQIEELDTMPSYEINSYGASYTERKFQGGCRYYISPTGKLFRMEFRKTGLNHCSIEEELATLGILPDLTFKLSRDADEYEHTSPIFEELGWIRIMRENAIILSAMPPTKEEYYAIEDWIEKWGELQSFYFQQPLKHF